MPRRRPPAPPPAHTPVTAPVPAPAPPPPAAKLTLAVPGGTVRLLHDKAGGRLLVAFDRPGVAGPLPEAVQTHLRDSGFTPPAEGETAWARPFDAGAGFSDIIDGERVVIRAAELIEQAEPEPGRRRGGRPADLERAEEGVATDATGTPEQPPPLTALERRIVDAAGDQLDRLDGCEFADACELREVVQEIGYVMAIKHLAEAKGLSLAGQVEAEKVIAASREWLTDRTGESLDGPER